MFGNCYSFLTTRCVINATLFFFKLVVDLCFTKSPNYLGSGVIDYSDTVRNKMLYFHSLARISHFSNSPYYITRNGKTRFVFHKCVKVHGRGW